MLGWDLEWDKDLARLALVARAVLRGKEQQCWLQSPKCSRERRKGEESRKEKAWEAKALYFCGQLSLKPLQAHSWLSLSSGGLCKRAQASLTLSLPHQQTDSPIPALPRFEEFQEHHSTIFPFYFQVPVSKELAVQHPRVNKVPNHQRPQKRISNREEKCRFGCLMCGTSTRIPAW